MSNGNEFDLQRLVDKAKLFKLILAPSGRAFAELAVQLTTVCDLSVTISEVVASSESPSNPSLIVITGVEEADKEPLAGEPHLLAVLRERVMNLLEANNSVILLSRYPRLRYPTVAGSTVLEDARQYFPQIRVASKSDSALHALPCYGPSDDQVSFLTDVVSEIGVPLAARLDQILFESSLTPAEALGELSNPELDALHFAGLVVPTDGHYQWTIPRALSDLKEALSNCLAQEVDPPRDLGEAFELLWRIERRVRAAIRRHAIEEWKATWKISLAHPAYTKQILERAGGVAYNRPISVSSIRDPLEWLTLPELLALRTSKDKLGELGMPGSYWRRLAMDVIPIRNQVSHMRFLKPGDITTLRQWNAVLTRELH